jgi:hypothetical protein
MMSQFLDFDFECKTPSGKTSIWIVKSRNSRATLGGIMWSGAWRKYIFRTISDCDFDWNCLAEIIEFCKLETEKHKNI